MLRNCLKVRAIGLSVRSVVHTNSKRSLAFKINNSTGKNRKGSSLLPTIQQVQRSRFTSDGSHISIPRYVPRENEPLQSKISRLEYQSRKRGMLENDLLLSTFADKYLRNLTEEQLDMYDKLINVPDNDWDLYDWLIEKKKAPEEFQTEVLQMLIKHSKNEERELRNAQPPLRH
ncbi:DgyrCDS10848 [Dimorphilus gyrociliatus]|uniref:Succinate dehydrogenase assembly factor 2, mitochondrial n=1 Tax=Dimorphilus gyrociliatus TaxID=2664684 RepID=A0A7I8W3G8_9ANNE|nr:DgyrCDS10848 [Dimorphilus gyrociliatus]